MSLYISTTFAKDKTPVSNVLNLLNSFNIKNIELGSNHCWEKSIKNKLLKYPFNFLVHNYFPVPKKNIIINIASSDYLIRKKSIKHIKNSILFTKKINASLYTFHPGFIMDPISESKSKKNYDFKFKKFKKNEINYNNSFNSMVISLKEIVKFAKKEKIKIAIETEGSRKKNFYFLYHYDEYLRLYKIFNKNDFGLNLNLGHLNLASKCLGFDKLTFIKKLKKYIVAIEMSHNNGLKDEHLPLKKNAWYWTLLKDKYFKKAYKIMEFRNTSINQVLKNIKLFNEHSKKI